MEDPEEEEKEEQRELMASFIANANFSFWLLEIVCRESNVDVVKRLFVSKTIRALRRFVEIISWDEKGRAVSLITDIAHQIHKVQVDESVTLELDSLLTTLIHLMKKRYRLEDVATSNSPSQILQALVEAVIVLDSALSHKILKLSGGVSLELKALPEGVVALPSTQSGNNRMTNI